MMFVPHRKHTYGHAGPVTGVALHFYVAVMFLLHRKPTYDPPRPVTGITLLIKVSASVLFRT
jgi:hypothetical protein